MRQVPEPLTFTWVDGLAFAAERSRLTDSGPGTVLTVTNLGPLMELSHLAADGLIPQAHALSWLELDGVGRFYAALRSSRLHWLCPHNRQRGFLRTDSSTPIDESSWTAFGLAAQKSAIVAGFSRRVAAQLIAATGEMHSNILEHSDASATGLLAFSASPGMFEFVVADRGRGVLSSLRSGAEYAQLTDHGEALRLALTNGVSRFGSGSDRGMGFRPLFIGLANLRSSLRFRSGNHALTIDGREPTLITANLAEKPSISGFFASVICELDEPSSSTPPPRP